MATMALFTPVIHIAGSTRLLWFSLFILESRRLSRSHIVMLDRTSSVCEPTPVVHSCIQINPMITGSSCIIWFTPADTPQINLHFIRTDGFDSTVSFSSCLFIPMSRPSAVDCIAGLFLQSSVGLSPHLSVALIVVCSGLNRYCCQAYWLYLLLMLAAVSCYGR
jgi:hypothetical protein